MILTIILLAISAVASIYITVKERYSKALTFIGSIVFFTIIVSGISIVLGLVNYALNSETKDITYTQKIVSLSDGTGISGSYSGGLFLSRGSIQDTQNFSYYIQNDNGSFNLQKRDADKSTIWQASSPEDARVNITDAVTECKDSWWGVCISDKSPQTFVKAEFFIPENSITNEYRLDAQ